MPGFRDLFSSSNFKSTVERYCSEVGWKIAEIDDRRAVIRFRMDSGRRQTLYIIRYDETLEFSCPSALAFDTEDDVPHGLSTKLMQRNSQTKIGFWCIEEIQDKHVFSCMHNAEMELMNTEYFRRVVNVLVGECDRFEGAVAD